MIWNYYFTYYKDTVLKLIATCLYSETQGHTYSNPQFMMQDNYGTLVPGKLPE